MNGQHMAETASRVAENTNEQVNQRIQFLTEATLAHYAQRLDQIDSRLRQLQAEWDTERALQTNAGFVIGFGILLGLFVKPLRLLAPAVSAFMVMHAVEGWCPPLPIMRRMGVRTAREINRERYALKALRGEFQGLAPGDPGASTEKAQKAVQIVSEETAPAQMPATPAYEQPFSVP